MEVKLVILLSVSDAIPEPSRYLTAILTISITLIEKEDSSIVLSVPDHTANRLIHCSSRLLHVPSLPSQTDSTIPVHYFVVV